MHKSNETMDVYVKVFDDVSKYSVLSFKDDLPCLNKC